MKRNFIIPLALFTTTVLFLSTSLWAETRRALVAGIHEYYTQEMKDRNVKQRRGLLKTRRERPMMLRP